MLRFSRVSFFDMSATARLANMALPKMTNASSSFSTSSTLALSSRRCLSTNNQRRHIMSRCLAQTSTMTSMASMSMPMMTTSRRFKSDVSKALPQHEDLYARLGLDHSCSADEIKKHYRQLAKKYHPDTNVGDKSAEENFRSIKEAYEVLNDASSRSTYDRTGKAPKYDAGMRPGMKPGFNFNAGGWRAYATVNSQGQKIYHIPRHMVLLLIFSVGLVFTAIGKAIANGDAMGTLGSLFLILMWVSFLPRLPAACIIYYFHVHRARRKLQEAEQKQQQAATIYPSVTVVSPPAGIRNAEQSRVVALHDIPESVPKPLRMRVTVQRGQADATSAPIADLKTQLGAPLTMVLPPASQTGTSARVAVSLLDAKDNGVAGPFNLRV